MRPTFDRRLWILLYIVLSKCIHITNQDESFAKTESLVSSDYLYDNEQQQSTEDESAATNSGHNKLQELADIKREENVFLNNNRILPSLCANCNERLSEYDHDHFTSSDSDLSQQHNPISKTILNINNKQQKLRQKQKQKQKSKQKQKIPRNDAVDDDDNDENDDNSGIVVIANHKYSQKIRLNSGNSHHRHHSHDNIQRNKNTKNSNDKSVRWTDNRQQVKGGTHLAKSRETITTHIQRMDFDDTDTDTDIGTGRGYSDDNRIYKSLLYLSPRSTKHSQHPQRRHSQKYISDSSSSSFGITKDRKKKISKNQKPPLKNHHPANIKATTTTNITGATNSSTSSSIASSTTTMTASSSALHDIKMKFNEKLQSAGAVDYELYQFNFSNRTKNETTKKAQLNESLSYFNENERVRRSANVSGSSVALVQQPVPDTPRPLTVLNDIEVSFNSNNNNNINSYVNSNSESDEEKSHVFRITDNNKKLLNSSDISKSDIRYKKTNNSTSSSISKDINNQNLYSNLSARASSSSSSSPYSSAISYYSSTPSLIQTPAPSALSSALNFNENDILLDGNSPLDSAGYSSSSLSSSSSSEEQKLSSSGGVVINDNFYQKSEPIIIIDDVEEFDSGIAIKNDDYPHDEPPRALPLRPIIRGPYDGSDHDAEMSIKEAEQHTEITLKCDVYLNISTTIWYKNGQIVHAMDQTSRVTDYRFIKDAKGGLTITNVMLEDDGKWQCEAENTRGYVENARPIKLVVLDRPKPPYLLIDSRRLDAGNIFVPVKENSELNLACVSEGGNPKPTLTWEVLLSPGVDRHAQKVAAEVLELEEIKNEKDKLPYNINSGAKSEARLPAVYRAHHNARILCVMEHPTLKIRLNASLLLDVQYTPSFAISRTPGFGYPLREGIEVSLKCDVDSNPPSSPRWMKDDGDTPVEQIGDGFLNFTSIRREHSGWYKCTSRHLNFQYSSIGYYLSVRYESVDVTSEPDDQEVSVAASHNPNKGQMEVQLGGAVTLQCPQGSLGCWSHLDPVTARLRGLGIGLSTPSGQFSLKDVVYQDAGTYKCIGQSATNKKKLEVLQTVGVLVKGAPTATARNATPIAYPGSPLHLAVEFCANPAAHAARWLHGDRVYTPGNQYGSTVLAYGVTDLPTPFCKEARLTYVSMHERVPRTFYFIVSSPGGVAEATFKVNFTLRYRSMSNAIDEDEEELSEPEEIHFPVFGSTSGAAGGAGGIGAAANGYHYFYHTSFVFLIMTKLLLSLYNNVLLDISVNGFL